MIRTFIADEHFIVRRGLEGILSAQPDMVLVGEARTGEEAIQAARGGGIDVLVIEVALPGKNGVTATREIRRACPDVRVLVFTAYEDESFAIRAIEAGASGFLSKSCGGDELVAAIRAVARDEHYVSESIAKQLEANGGRRRSLSPAGRLSTREYEVMRLLAAGISVRHIAEQLGRSIKTVHTHRYRIFEKLGVSSNSELTRYALKAGIAD